MEIQFEYFVCLDSWIKSLHRSNPSSTPQSFSHLNTLSAEWQATGSDYFPPSFQVPCATYSSGLIKHELQLQKLMHPWITNASIFHWLFNEEYHALSFVSIVTKPLTTAQISTKTIGTQYLLFITSFFLWSHSKYDAYHGWNPCSAFNIWLDNSKMKQVSH